MTTAPPSPRAEQPAQGKSPPSVLCAGRDRDGEALGKNRKWKCSSGVKLSRLYLSSNENQLCGETSEPELWPHTKATGPDCPSSGDGQARRQGVWWPALHQGSPGRGGRRNPELPPGPAEPRLLRPAPRGGSPGPVAEVSGLRGAEIDQRREGRNQRQPGGSDFPVTPNSCHLVELYRMYPPPRDLLPVLWCFKAMTAVLPRRSPVPGRYCHGEVKSGDTGVDPQQGQDAISLGTQGTHGEGNSRSQRANQDGVTPPCPDTLTPGTETEWSAHRAPSLA